MKKYKLLTFFFIFALTPLLAQFVEIGTETGHSSDIPFWSESDYGWSHFILPIENVPKTLRIERLEFYIWNCPAYYTTNNQTIYMRFTNETSVSNDYIANPLSSGYTEVFTGDITWGGHGWQGINLTTVLDLDGTSNIEIIWENRDGSAISAASLFSYAEANSAGAYDSANDSFPVSTGTSVNYYPITRLIQHALFSVTPEPNSVDISITPTISFDIADDYSYYQLFFSNEPNPQNQIIELSPVNDPVVFTFTRPLEYETDYYWKVRLHDDDNMEFDFNFSFTTIRMNGLGTEETPYEVVNLRQLIAISQDVTLWNKHFTQLADIDASPTSELNNGEGFSRIGHYFSPFTGSYDGQGYKISNLYINNNSVEIGLFGFLYNANILNIKLIDNDITASELVGSLVGSSIFSTITNCSATGQVNGDNEVGGLVGYSEESIISNCYTTGPVIGTGYCAGGLVGSVDYSSTITNCYATGSVSGDYHVGCLVGYGRNSTTTNSYASGSVNAIGSSVGGLAGTFVGTMNNCSATGQVNGLGNVGGLTGSFSGIMNNCSATGSTIGTSGQVGGLVGLASYDSAISNSHAEGYVNGNIIVGGLVGRGAPCNINNCYATGEVNALNRIAGGLLGASSSQSSIIDSYATGNVSVPYDSAGGLVGQSSAIIVNSYASGFVNGGTTCNKVGGLVGYLDDNNYHDSTVINCYASGAVSGNEMIGGLVGKASTSTFNESLPDGAITNCYASGLVIGVEKVGGLVGYSFNFIIENCYANGTVSGVSEVGGLVGSIYGSSTTTNSFWDVETTNQSLSQGGIGKTTQQMNNIDTYLNSGWDFIDETTNGILDIWSINLLYNSGYPFFAYEYSTTPLDLVPQYPADEMVNIPINDNLLWETTCYNLNTNYKLSLGTDNPPTNLLNEVDLGFTTFYEYNNLEAYTTYYWQVIPYSSNNNIENDQIWSFTTGSASNITIGKGVSTDERLPIRFDPYQRKSYSQSIYLQSELNLKDENIKKLAFYLIDSFNLVGSNQWKVFLGHTNKNEFADGYDWLMPDQGLTEVADITLDDMLTQGWVEIELTNEFTYNNVDNLIVGVIEYNPERASIPGQFYTAETNSFRSLSRGSTWDTPDPSVPMGGNLLTSIPKIKFITNSSPTLDLPESLTFEINKELIVDMSQYLADLDEDPLSISVSGNENIIVGIDHLIITFRATPAWIGREQLTFTVEDGVTKNIRSNRNESSSERVSASATIDIIVTPKITPVVTKIVSNFPNPFNTSTTIQYSLNKAGLVKFAIYNLKGQVTKKLYSGYREAGEYNILWDGLNNRNEKVASGIYYIRMKCDGRSYTRKINLLK